MNRLTIKFLTLFVFVSSILHLQAQERWLDVYRDGAKVMTIDVSKVDSITFRTTQVNEEDSYQTKLEKERKAISDYIQRNNIKVIFEEEFHANGGTTDIAQNEYVLFRGNGIYLQIVEKGCGEPIANGEACSVLCRFNEWNIMGDSLQLSNTMSYFTMVDKMNVIKRSDEVIGNFTDGLMLSTYGSSSVPIGWLFPLNFVNLGRIQTENDKLARINVIVPSSVGQCDATAKVYPALYNLTVERRR